LTAEPNDTVSPPSRDAGFTLPELLIVIVLMGVLMPVLAMAFSVVVRTSPTSDARADDSRSLNNLTNWISQDVSSTSEDGFFIGVSAPDGGCVLPPNAAGSVNLLELHWKEGTKQFVSNYRFVSNSPADGKGRIFRYACLKGGSASELRMTAALNEVASSSTNPFAPAPVRISPVPTTRADGSPGIKGVQLVVLIFDDYGIQRELLNLDATTTNIATLLPGTSGGFGGTNLAPTASDLSITMVQGSVRLESLPAIDPNGDLLFTTFPGPQPVPPSWNILATGTTIEIAPDPSAPPATYPITYRVTDPSGLTADATLSVTIVTAAPGNLPPIAESISVSASPSLESTATLNFSDPEEAKEDLQVALVTGDIPAGWLASVTGDQFRVTPSATATTSVIRYTVTDSFGQTATSQITVDLCEVSSMFVTPQTVGVKGSGGLQQPVTVEIATNGACGPLVLGFKPNDTLEVEVTESFNASNVVTISESTSYAWVRPANNTERVVPLNVRQGANGPVLLSANLITTR
jgi:prepilin-type N-terminal cleavage/methylation domain-containing protein